MLKVSFDMVLTGKAFPRQGVPVLALTTDSEFVRGTRDIGGEWIVAGLSGDNRWDLKDSNIVAWALPSMIVVESEGVRWTR